MKKLDILHSFFVLSSKFQCVFYTYTAHLHSNAKFLSEILDLHLHFIKLIFEKLDSHTQAVLNILRSFLITKYHF